MYSQLITMWQDLRYDSHLYKLFYTLQNFYHTFITSFPSVLSCQYWLWHAGKKRNILGCYLWNRVLSMKFSAQIAKLHVKGGTKLLRTSKIAKIFREDSFCEISGDKHTLIIQPIGLFIWFTD